MRAVIVCVVVLAVAGAYGQAYGSTLTLDPIPGAVYAGQTVTFTGMLTSGGSPVSGATVHICEDDPFIPDECLVRATTGYDGRFSADWVAEEQAVEIELDIYAKFDGDGQHSSDRSSNRYMSVYEAVGLQSTAQTTVRLFDIPSWVYVGDIVVFAGTLTSDGFPLSGRTVWICEDDPFIPDECLARATTNNAGEFYAEWTAKAGLVETDFDIYAEFDGDGSYSWDQTPRHTMSVYKYGGSITLDPIPTSAAFGETIALSGTLVLVGRNPEGAIVYIQDEDTLNPDDLLTSAYVDAAGNFSTYWVVDDVDPDYTIDIRAVFEGDAKWSRQVSPIQEMTWHGEPSGPQPGPTGGEEYMEIDRSVDFERAPRILIVPSPDSYDEVRGHIAPVQEGILQLTSMLEQEYSTGDWAVEFDVASPGSAFVSSEPDIIISLVTRDDNSGCNDWWGYSYTIYPKPVPAVVCSVDSRTDAQIGSTAAHEFIHAIGIGHTFNIRGDMMCSVENGVPTCPSGTKSTNPSGLNLAAIAAAYGTDGFQNPNNLFSQGYRFTAADITTYEYDQSEYENVFWPEACFAYADLNTCIDYYCVSYWATDGFSSYDGCLADPFVYVNPYEGVVWPEDCSEDDWLCLNYYCARWWDFDGFSSYDVCLADPYNP